MAAPAQINIGTTLILIVHLFVLCAGLEEIGLMGLEPTINNQIQPFPFPVEPQSHLTNKRYPAHLANFDMKQWIRVGECPEKSVDGTKLFYCPSLTPDGRHACIDDHQLCNGMKECPNAEDENRNYCFFYKALKAQVENVERSMGTLGQMFHTQQLSPRARKYGKKQFY